MSSIRQRGIGAPIPAPQRPQRPSDAPPLSATPIASSSGTQRIVPARKASAGDGQRSRGMLLNKRQSVSHASAAAAGFIPPSSREMPDVPSLPSSSRSRTGPGNLDLEELGSDNFDADRFLKSLLPGGSANPEALRKLKSNLRDTLESTNGELQANVLKNYSEFVTISKEIATLEADMLELKVILEEWKGVPSSLEIATDASTDLDLGLGASLNPRRAQRNSIADLAALHRTQLQSLWENVEGAQRFLPPAPGRHLIAESAAFVELNAATYTPRQGVHLFLLNDSLLVAVKKRSGVTTTDAGPSTPGKSKTRLVADRCYALSDIVVVDLKDGGELFNAIKVKKAKQTSIFRCDRVEDKRALLTAFKKVAEELMSKKRKQSLWEAETRKERSGGPGGSLGPLVGFSPSQHFGFGKDDPSGKDLSWIGDFADELAVAIALHDYEAGVKLVEKGKTALPKIAGDAHASALFRLRLEERSAELSEAILRELADVHVGKAAVVKSASWLLRLGEADRARERFLATRAQLVRKRARQIKFEGDVSLYVSELAMVCFTLIKNTCEWYMAAFKENTMASGFVRWASQQVEAYAEMFKRQVYGPDQDPVVIEESLAVTRASSSMLKDVGLDLGFHLDSALAAPMIPGR